MMQCRQGQQVTSNTFLTLSSTTPFLPCQCTRTARGTCGLHSRDLSIYGLMSLKSLQVSVCWNQWGKKVWMTRVSTISNTHQLKAGRTCISLKFYKWRVFTENTLRIGLKVFIPLCHLPHTTLEDWLLEKCGVIFPLTVCVCVHVCVCVCFVSVAHVSFDSDHCKSFNWTYGRRVILRSLKWFFHTKPNWHLLSYQRQTEPAPIVGVKHFILKRDASMSLPVSCLCLCLSLYLCIYLCQLTGRQKRTRSSQKINYQLNMFGVMSPAGRRN